MESENKVFDRQQLSDRELEIIKFYLEQKPKNWTMEEWISYAISTATERYDWKMFQAWMNFEPLNK